MRDRNIMEAFSKLFCSGLLTSVILFVVIPQTSCTTIPQTDLLVEAFSEFKEFWKKNGCFFPSKFDFGNPSFPDMPFPLKACSSENGMTTFATDICLEFFDRAKEFCHAENLEIAQLTTDATWDVCASVDEMLRMRESEQSSIFGFLTKHKDICRSHCVESKAIAPVCKLLVAAAVKYDERRAAAAVGKGNLETIEKSIQTEDTATKAPPKTTTSTPTPPKTTAPAPTPPKTTPPAPTPPKTASPAPTPPKNAATTPAPPKTASPAPTPPKNAATTPAPPSKNLTSTPTPPKNPTPTPAPEDKEKVSTSGGHDDKKVDDGDKDEDSKDDDGKNDTDSIKGGNGKNSSSSAIIIMIVAVVVVLAAYVLYHKRKLIMGYIVEGNESEKTRSSGGDKSKVKYGKLKPSADEELPYLGKAVTTRNYIY